MNSRKTVIVTVNKDKVIDNMTLVSVIDEN